METTLLIDVSNVAYRNFFALKKAGLTENATIYGVLRDIVSLTENFQTKRLVFCFDDVSLRKQFYPAYKGKRLEDEDRKTVKRELLRLYELLPIVGFRNVLRVKNFEADDLIACLCPAFHHSVIVSTDRDLWQLLREAHTEVWDSAQKSLKTEAWLMRLFGLTPRQYLRTKTLIGDVADNIAGIPKIGQGRAKQFVLKTMSVKSQHTKVINEHRQLIRLNHELMKLPYCKLPAFSWQYQRDEVAVEKWNTEVSRLNLQSLIGKCPHA